MIKMPDITLKLLLDSILGLIKSDYASAGDKSTTFLYKMYNGLIRGKYNFLDEAVRIFIRESDDPRTIDTRNYYDRGRASLPTIHVTMPAEQPHADGIGMDAGYIPNTADGPDPETATTMTEYLTRSYNPKFELIITGSNTFEVTLISTTLKAALINNVESLEVNGFRNPKIYEGTGLRINESIQPVGYMRSIVLDCFYELVVPKFTSINIVNNINWEGTAYNE